MRLKGQNPFVPYTGADPPYLAGRDEELSHFKKAFQATVTGSPAHVSFLGDFGTGKTILLKECRRFAQAGQARAIAVKLYEITEPSILVNLIASKAYEAIPEARWQEFKPRLENLGFQVLGMGINLRLEHTAIEPQTTLERVLHEIYRFVDTPIVVTIDDFQEVSERKQLLTVLRNVLTSLSEREDRVMLIVAGTEDVLRATFPLDPINRFFLPKLVSPLNELAVQHAITEPLKGIAVSISDLALQKISELSEGNPFYVQLLGYHFFECRGENTIQDSVIPKAIMASINNLAELMYEKLVASASAEERKVLKILLKQRAPMTPKGIRDVAASHELRAASVNPLLGRLRDKGLIKSVASPEVPHSRSYVIRDKLFAEYLQLTQSLEQ